MRGVGVPLGGRASLSAILATALVVSTFARASPAINQFEIKSLEVVPGRAEFQSQNAFSLGNPRRAVIADGGIDADDNAIGQARYGLELEYGFTHFFKGRIGIEYEKERLDDPQSLQTVDDFVPVRLDEYALEGILVFVPRPQHGLGVGLLVEYEHAAEVGGAQTLNVGPILEFNTARWLATFNPSLVQFIGGERNEAGQHDDKVDFAYTVRILYRASDAIALALEAYGTVERIGRTGHRGEAATLFGDSNQHRLGPVLYWTVPLPIIDADVTLGTGILAGLNADTPDATLKISLEVEY